MKTGPINEDDCPRIAGINFDPEKEGAV